MRQQQVTCISTHTHTSPNDLPQTAESSVWSACANWCLCVCVGFYHSEGPIFRPPFLPVIRRKFQPRFPRLLFVIERSYWAFVHSVTPVSLYPTRDGNMDHPSSARNLRVPLGFRQIGLNGNRINKTIQIHWCLPKRERLQVNSD